ncbi:hypothetical protein [Kosakonia cowanii]|uniref:hypothetical protein n=1 Tax=Kosakonia cowanii TaxID=208223 RepID=UPI00289D7BD3|nr:hypothetical protein [Kosakonia cowanii]
MSEMNKEALAAACAEKVKRLEFSVKQSAFDSVRRELETELAIARVALRALREPVAPVVDVERLQESAYKAGLTAGWNFGIENNSAGFDKCMKAHEYTAPPAPVVNSNVRRICKKCSASIVGYSVDSLCEDCYSPAPVVAELVSQPYKLPEWTNEQCLEFLAVAFRHAEIKGDFELDDLRLGVKMANAMTTGKEG